MISGKVDIFIQVKANHFSPVNPPLFGKVRQKFVLRRRRGKNDNGLSIFIDGFFYRRRGILGGRFIFLTPCKRVQGGEGASENQRPNSSKKWIHGVPLTL